MRSDRIWLTPIDAIRDVFRCTAIYCSILELCTYTGVPLNQYTVNLYIVFETGIPKVCFTANRYTVEPVFYTIFETGISYGMFHRQLTILLKFI